MDIVSSVAFSPCNNIIAIASYDKTISLYGINPLYKQTFKKQILCIKRHKDYIRSIRFSPCGNYLASCGEDRHVIFHYTGNLYIKNIKNISNQTNTSSTSKSSLFGKKLLVLKDHKFCINSICFSNNNKYFVSGGDDGRAILYVIKCDSLDINNYNATNINISLSIVKVFSNHGIGVFSVDFSSDSSLLAVGDMDGFATIYSISENILKIDDKIQKSNIIEETSLIKTKTKETKPTKETDIVFLKFKTHGEVYKVIFSLSGDYLAISTFLSQIYVYGINKNNTNSFNKEIFRVGNLDETNINIINFSFSPNEDYIVVGKSNSKVTVYKINNTNYKWLIEEVKELSYHDRAVFSVRISPYGNYFATGSSDNSAIIYC